jgi:hypothetical protein
VIHFLLAVVSSMSFESLEVRMSPVEGQVLSDKGAVLKIPETWSLLLPGDAALSRRIKKDGPTWTMVEMKGRKKFSRGIWAPHERIEVLRAQLEGERSHPSYQKKLDAGRDRRAKEQLAYAREFKNEVVQFLSFADEYKALAEAMGSAIAEHAVPVGSGTVARTKLIPIERRAEAAVIAWMRHQTTAYDDMVISREKGRRREVRRMLAQRSRLLLQQYREFETGDIKDHCPLKKALGL